MQTYTIVPLAVGLNETDQGVMTYLRDYGKRIYLPIYSFLIQGGDQTIVVDTGLEQFVIPDGAEETLGFRVYEFEAALAAVGLSPDDIGVIIHTHLHNDHCENDFKCRNAKVYVQRAELDFMRQPHPVDHRYYPDVLDDVQVVVVDGDTTLFDGIDVMMTPGHTVGGQSVCVRTSGGNAVITGFCCNAKNFPTTGPAVVPGVHLDVIQAFASVQKVKAAADILIPLHDAAIGRLRQIPG
jgi:glyoxylase-like metal-dependent hydrolase (beta-lactamase superfamily II)